MKFLSKSISLSLLALLTSSTNAQFIKNVPDTAPVRTIDMEQQNDPITQSHLNNLFDENGIATFVELTTPTNQYEYYSADGLNGWIRQQRQQGKVPTSPLSRIPITQNNIKAFVASLEKNELVKAPLTEALPSFFENIIPVRPAVENINDSISQEELIESLIAERQREGMAGHGMPLLLPYGRNIGMQPMIGNIASTAVPPFPALAPLQTMDEHTTQALQWWVNAEDELDHDYGIPDGMYANTVRDLLGVADNDTINLSISQAQTITPDIIEFLNRCPNLQRLELPGIQSLNGLPRLEHLEQLVLPDCPRLTSFAGMEEQPALKEIIAKGRSGIQTIDGLPNLPNLEVLMIGRNNGIRNAPLEHLARFPSLRLVQIVGMILDRATQDRYMRQGLLLVNTQDTNTERFQEMINFASSMIPEF